VVPGAPVRVEDLRISTDDVTPDLVEYMVVLTPDEASLAALVPALAELVAGARIRVLDLAVVVRGADGAMTVREVETVESLAGLRHVEGEVGSLLSQQDVATAGLALRPGTAGLVIVTESRWAEPLSVAARDAGGRIVGGERIPPRRLADALAELRDDEPEGG
jgi:Family of unknown function (DUF6325)